MVVYYVHYSLHFLDFYSSVIIFPPYDVGQLLDFVVTLYILSGHSLLPLVNHESMIGIHLHTLGYIIYINVRCCTLLTGIVHSQLQMNIRKWHWDTLCLSTWSVFSSTHLCCVQKSCSFTKPTIPALISVAFSKLAASVSSYIITDLFVSFPSLSIWLFHGNSWNVFWYYQGTCFYLYP